MKAGKLGCRKAEVIRQRETEEVKFQSVTESE
jgi:hypothetical protein